MGTDIFSPEFSTAASDPQVQPDTDTPEQLPKTSPREDAIRALGGFTPFNSPEPTFLGEVGKGVAAGARGLYGTAGGLIGLAGDALGSDSMKQFGLGTYMDQEEANNLPENAPAVGSLKDIHNFGNFADYAAFGLAKNITELVPLLATSEVGGLAAGGVAKEAVARATQYAVENGLDKAAAEKLVSAAVTRGGGDQAAQSISALTQNATERGMGADAAASFAEQATQAGEKQAAYKFAGAQAGNAAAMTAQSIGDEYGQTKDVGTSLGYGTAEGLINAAAMGIVSAPIFRKALGISAGEATEGMGQFAAKLGKKSAIDAAVLGGTGYVSTDLSQNAQASVDPNFDINSPEAKAQRTEALLSGALGGAAVFGPIGALERAHSPLTAEALRALDKRPEASTSAESGKEPPVGTSLGYTAPGDRVQPNDENWSQPVYVQKGNGGPMIRMQKDLHLNRWVIPDPDNLPDDLKSTGLQAVDGNVIIDPKNGAHAADLHMAAETALQRLNSPSVEKSSTKIDSNEELSKQTDTSGFTPAPVKSAEESADAILAGNKIEEQQRQSSAEADLLRRKLASQEGSEPNPVVGTDPRAAEAQYQSELKANKASFKENEDFTGQGHLPFVFSDLKEKVNPEPVRPPEQNKFVGGLKGGDEVAFADPDYGTVRATVEQEIQHHIDDPESDHIKLSFIDPKTDDIKTQVVPRSSWGRLAPAGAKLPSFEDIISNVTGDNPTSDQLQQLGFANILLDQRTGLKTQGKGMVTPGMSADAVFWDGLGSRPSLGDYKIKTEEGTQRVAEPVEGATGTAETSSRELLTEAYRTGDYSKVIEANLMPVRTLYGENNRATDSFEPTLGVRSYGIFTGGAADTKSEIQAAKEMTLRQWNMGLPVLAKRGQYIPDGFQWERLPNGKIKITAVEDYQGRTWRRGSTPESFSVDQPQSISGYRSAKSGVGMFDHFFNTDAVRIEASERAHEREAEKNNGAVASALKEPLSTTESNFFDKAMTRVSDILSRIQEWNGRKVDSVTLDKAEDAVKARIIRQMVPPPKEEQVKQTAYSRANRPAWVTKPVTPEQAVKNNRVEHLFLNSVSNLENLKRLGVTPSIKSRVERAESKIEPDTRPKEDQRFDPVRSSINGLQASEIAKRAYASAGEITPAEFRNIVQVIKETYPDLAEKELAHLQNVSDYYQSLSGKFSEANIRNLLYQELGSASKRTIADRNLRSGENVISKDNNSAGSIGENKMSLSSKREQTLSYLERNKAALAGPSFNEQLALMSHDSGAPDYVPEHLSVAWEGGQRVPTSEDHEINPRLSSLQQLDEAWSKLPDDLRAQVRKIGAKRTTNYNSESAKAYRSRVAPLLSPEEQRVLNREQDLIQKARDVFDEHLLAAQEARESKKKLTPGEYGTKDKKNVYTPLNLGEQAVMKRAMKQIRELLAPEAPEPRLEPNTPLKVDPNAPRETPSGVTWTKDKEDYVNKLLRAKAERERKANEYRSRINAKIDSSLSEENNTQNDVRTTENTPENPSGRNDSDGTENVRNSSRDAAQPQGGFGSIAGESTEADYDGGHLGIRGSSDVASTDVRGSSGATGREGSSLGASPSETRAHSAGARKLVVQSAGSLSKEETAGLKEPEVDRAYDALHNTADMRAVHGNEVITGTSPRVEDVANKSLKELLQGVAEEQRRYYENSVRADQIRSNHATAVRSGIFNSPLEFLKRVSEGKTEADPAAVMRAKSLLAMQGRSAEAGKKFDWNHVSTQVGSFRDGKNRAPFAGYLTREGNVYLNLDAAHRGGSIVNTYLHELGHYIEKDKVNSFLTGKGVALTPTEKSALERIRNFQETALRQAYSKTKGADPKATIAKMEKWAREKAISAAGAKGKEADRFLYPLSDLHETVRGLQDDPEFHRYVGETLGHGEARPGVTYTMSSEARSALNAITELNTGRKTDPNSPLARAFADSWEVTNSRNPDANTPSKLTDTLRDFNDRESWIRWQLNKRDLHGTSNDRLALRNEWDAIHGKAAKPSVYLPQPKPIDLKTGTDIGYREPTPEPRAVNKEAKPSATAAAEKATEPSMSLETSPSEGVIKAQQRVLAAEEKIQELKDQGKIVMMGNNQETTTHPEALDAFSERHKAMESLKEAIKESKKAKPAGEATNPVGEATNPAGEATNPAEAATKFETPNAQYFDNVTKVPEVRALLKEAIQAIKDRAALNPGGGTGFREQAVIKDIAEKRIAAIKESRKAGNRPSAKEPITLQQALDNPEGVPPKTPEPAPEPPKNPTPEPTKTLSSEPTKTASEVSKSESSNNQSRPQNQTPTRREGDSKSFAVDENRVMGGKIRKAAVSMSEEDFKKWFENPNNLNPEERVRGNASEWYKSSNRHYKLVDGELHVIPNVASEKASKIQMPEAALDLAIEPPEGHGSLSDFVRERVPFGKDLLGEKIATHNGGYYEKGGLLNSAYRNLDPRVNKAHNDKVDAARAEESRAALNARRLEQSIKESYPKGAEIPHETMNTALGNIANYLTDEDVDKINAMRKSKGTKAAEMLRQDLLEQRRSDYRLEQQKALDSLPPKVAAAITKMTDHIAALQRSLSDQNIVSGDLKATIDKTGRIYLNRSYQVFDDPKWADKVKSNPEVINAASKFFRKQLVDRETRSVLKDAHESGTPMTDSEARKIADSRVTDGMVNAALDRVLDVHGDEIDRLFSHGRLPGRKDLSIFDKRGQISEEIQNLWGVNKDPELNYARTVTKMSGLIANHQFLSELRDSGINEGWIWNPKAEENIGERPPRGYDKLVAEGNKSLAPLDGLFMKKELGDALYRMFPKNGDDDRPAWLRYMMKLTGWTMGAKTVLSPAAQIRHNLGNPISLISTGNLSLGDIFSGKALERVKLAGSVANPFKSLESAEKVQAEVEKLHRLGILHQSVEGRLLRELLGDQRNQGQAGYKNVWQKYVTDPLNMVTHTAEKSYEFGDAMYKTAIFYGEKEKYSRAHPTWSEEKVEAKAAQIARDCHWTYDLTPSFTKELSKFPFIAPFIRFTTEVYRTSFNLCKLAHSEITEGISTGNKELAEIGYQRLRGMATVALGPSVAIAAWQAAHGFTDDDQEALRKFLPEWQKNSQIFMLNKEGGKVGFYDFSYLDHYKVIREPLIALGRALHNSDNAEQFIREGVIGGVLQAANPYLREQIFAGAAMDVMRNKSGASGAPVYNPQDTPTNIGLAIGQHIGQAFMPGVIDSGNRIVKAATGQTSDSGRSYDLGYELGSVMGGQRIAQTDVPNALQFKASNFVRNERDATQLFGHEFSSRGDRTPDQVIDGYNRSNNARMALVQDMRNDYLSAIQLGMSPEQAQQALRGSHLSQDVVDQVVTGQYKQYQPSKASTSLVQSRGQNDRIEALKRAMSSTPAMINLPR